MKEEKVEHKFNMHGTSGYPDSSSIIETNTSGDFTKLIPSDDR